MLVKCKSNNKIYTVLGTAGENNQFYVVQGLNIGIEIMLLKTDCEVIND